MVTQVRSIFLTKNACFLLGYTIYFLLAYTGYIRS